MGFWEWYGERLNPGELATVEVGRDGPTPIPAWLKMVRFAIAATMVGVGLWLLYHFVVFKHFADEVANASAVIFGALFAYLVAAFIVRPKVPRDNMGWLGGLMDNPFRYSDDWNRFMFSLGLLLIPGRFVAESVMDVLSLVYDAGSQTPADPEALEEELAFSRQAPGRDDPFAGLYEGEAGPATATAAPRPQSRSAAPVRGESWLGLVGLFLAIAGGMFGVMYFVVLGAG